MDSFFKALVRAALWAAVVFCLLGGLMPLLMCLLPGDPLSRGRLETAAAMATIMWYLAFAVWISWLRRPNLHE